uniref:Uncharacterized protein LOC111117596 n=1 Tax=Crassostrea virginica TaxID=6565 RepID=A0A8B8C9M7_CRAVI|nr:uncharacterized protein LOC111117596 [Crassostrea virginica]
MISFNNDQQTCLCCEDLSGSDVTSPGWKTYLPNPPCQDGYAAYIAPEFQVCLKFVPVSSDYTKAKEHCEAEGGDLIRIDSTLKYDIFKQMLARHDSGGGIEVWIQAVLVNQEWRFHDGSVVPEVCPRSVGVAAGEDYLRAKSANDFKCYDINAGHKCLYICEYNL